MAMVRCTACGYQIPAEAFRPDEPLPCPLCARAVTGFVLPAATRGAAPAPPALPEEPPGPGEAACFYSPSRKAIHTCGHCGVFISAAWSAKWGAETVCLKCLEELRTRRKDARFEARRTLWDNIALASALLPFAVCLALTVLGPVGPPFMIVALMISIVTAPTALGIALISWKKPRSLVPRGRARLATALFLGVLQCAAWGAFFIAIANRQFNLD